MRKILLLLLVTGFSLAFSSRTSAQAHLQIIQIDSFPDFPGDTAFEGVNYNHIRIHVVNVGNSAFFGEIEVFLSSQIVGDVDTLRDDGHPGLLPAGDTIILPGIVHGNPNFRFKSIHYAAGDNIIVVWPYSAGTGFNVFQSRIYFAQVTAIPEAMEGTAGYYLKNPVSTIINPEYPDKNKVEQVRIYDIMGREFFNAHEAIKSIDISSYRSGIYFFDCILDDGTHITKKIFISNN